MTYCVAIRLDEGLVFLSDSRTNAGVDHISTFRKMSVFEIPGERVMVLMTAGNLSISQSVRQLLSDRTNAAGHTIWTAPSMYEAAQILGDAIRVVHDREAEELSKFGIDFNVSILFGGQIKGEHCRLFQMYSAGNFIESRDENACFQIGESKYGKPILDRVVTPATTLDEAAKCALISMDSTLRSNISVGLPLDLMLYEKDSLTVNRFVTIDENNQYFQMIRSSWGAQLKRGFEEIADPVWNAAAGATSNVLSTHDTYNQPVRVAPPGATLNDSLPPRQSLAQQDGGKQPS
ncbi:proteasome-type protease [Herbaspirillum sp. RTI4]|uniref:proteasome-type protease n=1 Tax=Herbaspirillum sp. RTI4 TaxID=3048640 RepID=UPI002AB48108|nr:proteasome-type protease [Herbaspirillum sp. RTI4]MDY7576839.1 proteasome-type protease [Herbaspirillum sp. RTI4]MEA9983360.1 proteasome-type protease [Herbaspirillum sp. RTI4]